MQIISTHIVAPVGCNKVDSGALYCVSSVVDDDEMAKDFPNQSAKLEQEVVGHGSRFPDTSA